MQRPTKDEYYLNIACEVAKRSTCMRRKYGAVIVNNDEIIATGYNGSPRGMTNCCDVGYCGREGKEHNTGDYGDCNSVHAEQNALISAPRRDLIGATLYLVGYECEKSEWVRVPILRRIAPQETKPCPICSRMITNAGIERVCVGGEVH